MSQSSPKIAIIAHRHDSFEDSHYFLSGVADIWRDDGLCVSVVRDSDSFVGADIAILHVDLTVVPDEYLRLAWRYPVCLNREVEDISKRRISSGIVRQGDGYEGPVIVKTDRNCGGFREGNVAAAASLGGRVAGAVRRRLPWWLRSEIWTSEYRVFNSVKAVPWPVWRNPDLIVERFMPEMRNGIYCLRSWTFLGDHERSAMGYSQDPVVKASSVVRVELVEVPQELREMRRALNFDYGKFDYALVDGRVVLYDVNRTPSFGSLPREQYPTRARQLAGGIHAYCPQLS